MIDPTHWVAFTAASLLVAILPGPGVANIVGYAVNSGRRTTFAAIAGAVAGNLIAMTLSLAGVGSLLQAFPLAFRLVELAGAAYLVALGLIGILRARRRATPDSLVRPAISPRAAFAGSIAVSALNPKSTIFFMAFVPQFVASAGSYLVQSAVLVATFASIVAFTDTLYALLALRAAGLLHSATVTVWVSRAGGLMLIVIGLTAVLAW